MLLKSLVIIGATLGIVVGTIGTAIPWLFPGIFTQDKVVTFEVLFLFSFFTFCQVFIATRFLALSVTKQLKYIFVTDAQGHNTIFSCFIHHSEYSES